MQQSTVVYFALEGQEGFVARVEAFRAAHRISDIPFYLSADRIVLPKDAEAVVRSIKDQFPDIRPDVVVLDTLNRSIAGSENDPSDMGQYVRAADMIRAAFNCVVRLRDQNRLKRPLTSTETEHLEACGRIPGVVCRLVREDCAPHELNAAGERWAVASSLPFPGDPGDRLNVKVRRQLLVAQHREAWEMRR